MKKFFTLFICILYTFITFGGSIFVHNCGENTLLSVYEKASHDTCPLCSRHDNDNFKKTSCETGNCNDVEIKVDQLSDQLFSSDKASFLSLSPSILHRLWIEVKPKETYVSTKNLSKVDKLLFTNSSPPIFILNRNLRN